MVLSIWAVRLEAEPAIGQFELKDLDAEPGSLEFQSQNAHSWGQPNRKIIVGDDDEAEFDGNSVEKQRHALELEAAFTTFFRSRIGIEYEKERIDEPVSLADADAFEPLKLTEIAVEGVLVFVPVKTYGVGLGMLVEYEHPTDSSEARTILAGPIVEAKSGPWSAIANVTFIHFFGGDGEETDDGVIRDNKWDLGYALQVKYEVSETWALTLESYGTFDRLGNTGTRSEEAALFGDHDQHRAGPLVYYSQRLGTPTLASRMNSGPVADATGDDADETTLTVGAGLLFGLNENTPDATLKWSVEVEF